MPRPSSKPRKKTAKQATKRSRGSKPSLPYHMDTKYEVCKKNQNYHWNTYHNLQKRANEAWDKLRKDVKQKAPASVIMEDRINLVLLLGECNYMIRECKHFQKVWKKHK